MRRRPLAGVGALERADTAGDGPDDESRQTSLVSGEGAICKAYPAPSCRLDLSDGPVNENRVPYLQASDPVSPFFREAHKNGDGGLRVRRNESIPDVLDGALVTDTSSNPGFDQFLALHVSTAVEEADESFVVKQRWRAPGWGAYNDRAGGRRRRLGGLGRRNGRRCRLRFAGGRRGKPTFHYPIRKEESEPSDECHCGKEGHQTATSKSRKS